MATVQSICYWLLSSGILTVASFLLYCAQTKPSDILVKHHFYDIVSAAFPILYALTYMPFHSLLYLIVLLLH